MFDERELSEIYRKLEMKQYQLAAGLFHHIFESRSSYCSGFRKRLENGETFLCEFPIPVISVKGICDVLVWFNKIEVRASMNKKAVLEKAFDKFSDTPFEVYDAEDTYRFYKTAENSIGDMKAAIQSDSNGFATFSFFLPYETDGDAIYKFAKLIKREGFTY